jgi:hypothetical protein
MDKRNLVSMLAMAAFVLMLVGTSKAPSPGGSPSFAYDASFGFGGGASSPDATPSELGGPAVPEASPVPAPAETAQRLDGGPALGARGDAGGGRIAAPPSSPTARPSGFAAAPWDAMGLPIEGGKLDALRFVHRHADAARIEQAYKTALRTAGWALVRAQDESPTTRALDLTKGSDRLIVRIGARDADVVVTLNQLAR